MQIKRFDLVTTTSITRTRVSPTESSEKISKRKLVLVNVNNSISLRCPTDCTYNVTEGGNISSPLFPNNYPDGVKCVWILEAPVNHTVKLDLEVFHLEKDKKCFMITWSSSMGTRKNTI